VVSEGLRGYIFLSAVTPRATGVIREQWRSIWSYHRTLVKRSCYGLRRNSRAKLSASLHPNPLIVIKRGQLCAA